MARPKRIDFPFTLYHVFSRTNSGDLAFWDPADYNKFLSYLAKYLPLFLFRLHAFCLMPNHFHLLLESQHNLGLSELIRRLLTAYTVYFNHRHERHGHLFQGRFKSLVVDKNDYLLELSRYIHLNPSRMTPPQNPETFPYSSLRYYITGSEPAFLYSREILSWFEGDRKNYADFIQKGLQEGMIPRILAQKYVGGEDFARRMNTRFHFLTKDKSRAQKALKKNLIQLQEKNNQKAKVILKYVAEWFNCSTHAILNSLYDRSTGQKARLVFISLLREYLPWTCQQIAHFVGIKGTVYDHIKRLEKDNHLIMIRDQLAREIESNFLQ